jgi:pimeloyl-ACP methyl ester carboxylesterase
MATLQVGDARLNFVERGSGSPLLLVHGFPLDHTMWRGQLDALAARHRVIAPDLRGFGGSSVTPGTVSMAQMADDLAGLLAALEIAEPVIFCGLSMGGYVAWQFAQRHRDRLGKLILCDTRAIADTPEAAAGRLKTAEKVLAEGPQVVAEAMLPKLFSTETSAANPAVVAATKEVMLKTSPAGIAAALRGMAQRPDVTGQLGQLNVPALVLCGQHDAISPAGEMRGIAAAMPSAHYVEIERAGHMAPLEQPVAVNAAIEAFVS